MKKVILLLLLSVFLLSACEKEAESGKAVPAADTYVRGYDDQPFFGGTKTIAAADYGYYFLYSGYLYLYDIEAGEAAMLCGKPDCNHEDASCNACFSSRECNFEDYVGYYEDALYMVGTEKDDNGIYYLFRIAPDGSQREKLCALYKESEMGEDGHGLMAAVHRGYFYYSLSPTQLIANERIQNAYRIKLDGEKYEKEKIFEINGIGADIYGFWGYGNKVLFETCKLTDEQSSAVLYQSHYYDTKKETVVKDLFQGWKENTTCLYFHQNAAYYYNGENIYKKNPDTGKKEPVSENPDFMNVLSYDFQDVYILDDEEENISIYDAETLQKKDKIPLPPSAEWLLGDERNLLAMDEPNHLLYIYDKNQNGSKQKEWKKCSFPVLEYWEYAE